MATDLILIRHGNAVRVNGNYRHAPLTALGRQQAAQTGQYLRQQCGPPGVLYTSFLRRARETAEIVGAELGTPPTVVAGMQEMELHEVVALALMEALSILNPVEDALERHAGEPTHWPVVGRVSQVLTEVVAAHPDQRIAVVAHSGVISSTLAWFFPAGRLRWWTTRVGNCSLTQLRVEGARAELLTLAEVRHLAPVTATAQWPTRAARAASQVVRARFPNEDAL